MVASMLDNLPKYLTSHKAQVIDKKPPSLSCAPFCSERGFVMWIGLSLLVFAIGVLVGRLSVRRYRHDRVAWAQRRLQLKVLSLELKSLRSKVG
ncbi:hypothetical protein [Tepidimonas ignava]|nr:hypothetical protein [Tepidimonas ignava]